LDFFRRTFSFYFGKEKPETMYSRSLKQVKRTEHISFDEKLKTFRLYAGESLYSFCIGPELTLEHLYWGKKLSGETFDLRYLSESCRLGPFVTVESAATAPVQTIRSFDGKIVIKAENLEEIQRAWKENRSWSRATPTGSWNPATPTTKPPSAVEDNLQKRRIENYSWRILSKLTGSREDLSELASNHNTEALSRPRRRSFAGMSHQTSMRNTRSMDNVGDLNETAPNPREEFGGGTRRRKTIGGGPNLHQYKIHPSTSFQDLKLLCTMLTADECIAISPARNVPVSSAAKLDRLITRNGGTKEPNRYKSVHTFERQLGKLGKGLLCVEYTDQGTGDFRSPSFVVVDNFSGSSISPLRYRSHRIYKGKLPLENMPSIRCIDENEASTLVVTLVDIITGLEIDLIYGTNCTITSFFVDYFCFLVFSIFVDLMLAPFRVFLLSFSSLCIY
jgi:hypothetical protein